MFATLSRQLPDSVLLEDVVVFEASSDRQRTWSAAKRGGDSRWAEHDVHLGKSLSEFLGPGLDTVDLTVRFDLARGVIPRDELRALRELRDAGEVLQFVVGGDLVGDYTLRGLDEKWSHFDAAGVLTIAEVVIKLKEYA